MLLPLLGLLSSTAHAAPPAPENDPHRLVGSVTLLGYSMSLARVYIGGGTICSIEGQSGIILEDTVYGEDTLYGEDYPTVGGPEETMPEMGHNTDSRSCVVGGSAGQLQLGAQLFDPRRLLSPVLVVDYAQDFGWEYSHRTLTAGGGARVNLRPRGALSPFASGTVELGFGGGEAHFFPGVGGQIGLELGSRSGHHLDIAFTGRASTDFGELLSVRRSAFEVGYQF